MSGVRADHYRANRVPPEPFSTTGRLAQFSRGFRVSPDDVSGIYARAGQCFGPMFLKTPFSTSVRLKFLRAKLESMGLDAAEIVLRTKELFVVIIEDDEAATVSTVGNFYDLVCRKLDLTPLQAPVISAKLSRITNKEKAFLLGYKYPPLPASPEVLPWSPQSVWDCLVVVIVDQQGLKPEQIRYSARFVEDLGVD